MKPTWRGERTAVYGNPWITIYHQEVAFGEMRKTFYVNDFGTRSGVVAVRDQHVLMVRQYRLLPDTYTLEIPGGKIEDGETPEQAAIRECLEETGWECRALQPLATYYPGLDNVDNRTSVFFSEEVAEIRQMAPNPKEVIGIEWVPLATVETAIREGRQMDGLTILGVLGYLARTRPSASEV